LISGEPVAPGISISGIKLTCHRDSTNQPKPSNIYKSLLPLSTPES
jgi:hypothetical protein